jgi:hypothetical protein
MHLVQKLLEARIRPQILEQGLLDSRHRISHLEQCGLRTYGGRIDPLGFAQKIFESGRKRRGIGAQGKNRSSFGGSTLDFLFR